MNQQPLTPAERRPWAGGAESAAVAGIEVRLLGPLELSHKQVPVPLGPPLQRALLARLLLDANHAVATDRLVDDLWGDDVPPTAGKMIQIYVSKLRRVLPAGVLVTRPPGYAVTVPPNALDIVRFNRLRAQGRAALAGGSPTEAAVLLRGALALWRGSALAEFDAPFADIEARRLEELHVACVEDRIDADLARGDHAELVGELDALVAQHPLRERLRGQLMLALYRSGRQVEALAGYRRFRQMLATELALEPSPSLRELERGMLQHNPMLDLRAVEPHPGPAAALPWPVRAADSPGSPSADTRRRAALWSAARPSRRGACRSTFPGR